MRVKRHSNYGSHNLEKRFLLQLLTVTLISMDFTVVTYYLVPFPKKLRDGKKQKAVNASVDQLGACACAHLSARAEGASALCPGGTGVSRVGVFTEMKMHLSY